ATVTPVAVATTGSGGDHARLWGESTNPPGKIRKMMQQYVTRVTGALDVGFAAERELSDVLLEAELVNGDPGEIICEMSEAADLVIIGKNRSAGGRGLGRVAEHVARFADAHVIVVPTEARIDTPS
ncbi:MAG: nucleotide-binding universal stress UspA family protein, partial [Bradymonadia bacterium]